MTKPKAINRKKLVAFVLSINRKSGSTSAGKMACVRFFGSGSTEGGQPFVAGCRGGSALLGSRGNVHWRVEGSRPIGSRVKRLAQGELMPCVNSYWVLPDAETHRFDGFAAAPLWETQQRLGGMKIETDTTQRTLWQAWRL